MRSAGTDHEVTGEDDGRQSAEPDTGGVSIGGARAPAAPTVPVGPAAGDATSVAPATGAAAPVVAAEPEKPLIFREVQRFLWWVLLPVAIVTGIIWWTFAKQILLGQPVGEKPIPDWLAWLFTLVFGLGLPALALAMRLVTEVRPGSVSIRLFPFRLQPIPLAHVAEASVRTYSAAREYGGYGVRKGLLGLNLGRRGRNGWAYTARGDKGVQLVMVNGFRVLIGSQQPERLLSALRSAGGDFGPKKTTRKKRAPASATRAKAAAGARAKKGAAEQAKETVAERAGATSAAHSPATSAEQVEASVGSRLDTSVAGGAVADPEESSTP